MTRDDSSSSLPPDPHDRPADFDRRPAVDCDSLFGRYLDGLLTDDEFIALQSVLHDDPQARECFVEAIDIHAMLAGATTLEAEVDAGRIQLDGDTTAFDRLIGLLDDFRTWFPIVEP
jgi:hypothetical protein